VEDDVQGVAPLKDAHVEKAVVGVGAGGHLGDAGVVAGIAHHHHQKPGLQWLTVDDQPDPLPPISQGLAGGHDGVGGSAQVSLDVQRQGGGDAPVQAEAGHHEEVASSLS